MQRTTLYEEEKNTITRKSRREFSADDQQFRNTLVVDRKSGYAELVQYGSRKKTVDLEESDNLIE